MFDVVKMLLVLGSSFLVVHITIPKSKIIIPKLHISLDLFIELGKSTLQDLSAATRILYKLPQSISVSAYYIL